MQHVRLRVLQDAGEAGREVERSLARALSVLFSTVPLHVVLFFLEYAVPQIAVLGEEESQFVRSRGAAKDPADRHGCQAQAGRHGRGREGVPPACAEACWLSFAPSICRSPYWPDGPGNRYSGGKAEDAGAVNGPSQKQGLDAPLAAGRVFGSAWNRQDLMACVPGVS